MPSGFERRLYGHRGASALLPENTFPSFARALQDGANALETDIHVTSDGHVVLSHDPDGKRLAGIDRLVAQSTLEDVRAWGTGMRTLSEMLEAFPRVRINIDVKPAEESAAFATIDVIRRHDAEERVTLASFHETTAYAIRARYRGEISLAPWALARFFCLPFLKPQGAAVQIPIRHQWIELDKARLIARCHKRGLRVDYWVVNDPAEARRMLDLGADGIMTDNPGLFAPVMWGQRENTR